MKLAAFGSLCSNVRMGQKVVSVPVHGNLFGRWCPCASPVTLRVTFLQPTINCCDNSAVKTAPHILALELGPRGDLMSIFHVCKHFNAS